MRRFAVVFSTLVCAAVVRAHPMGNFSVSHYAKLQPDARGIKIHYVLDLAEIPTFELLRTWNLERSSPRKMLDQRASEQAREWLNQLAITVNGLPVHAIFESAKLVIADGAGGLPIMRISTQAHIRSAGGKLSYDDHNYPDRAGWKEIVIENGTEATLNKASQSNTDISKALTNYPPDPTIAPPQDLRAELEWITTSKNVSRRPLISHIEQPHLAPPAAAPATMTKRSAPAGTVVRGDFVSKLIQSREITPWILFVAFVSAFLLGAAHALTPGHGKTIVAAYLVGSRGTLKHAAFLGAMVTFTHTITVFALGLATLFLFRYIVPETVTEALGVVSGLSIVAVGAWMLYKRIRGSSHSHSHHHDHHHHNHDHGHDHHHHAHHHAHLPGDLSWAGLVALGASGGLVPCESALVLLLGAVALGHVGLGLLLLVAFSIGLALVLMLIGVLVLYAKNLIPERKRMATSGFFQWVAVVSPAVVIVVGLVMTGVSLRWIGTKWLIG